jgi:hypothetical protein
MIGHKYREALKETVVASAFPYGYTLTIWTSGAVLSHERGLPTSVDAVLFMAGALVGFALVGTIAFCGFHSGHVRRLQIFSLWEAFHLLSIGLSIGLATTVAHLLHSKAAWPLDGFLATIVYLTMTALQIAIVARIAGDEFEGPE